MSLILLLFGVVLFFFCCFFLSSFCVLWPILPDARIVNRFFPTLVSLKTFISNLYIIEVFIHGNLDCNDEKSSTVQDDHTKLFDLTWLTAMEYRCHK